MRTHDAHRPETGGADERRRRLTVAVTMVVLAAIVVGCGKDLQNVSGPGADKQPVLVSVPAGRTPLGPLTQDQTVTVTERITAQSGGQIVCGRHTLRFAPHALAQDTDITLVDATYKNGFVSAECYPEGLQFNATVTLESDFSDLAAPSGYNIYWLVDAPGGVTFVNMGGQVNSTGKGIITNLMHFSDYAPGKAGW